MLTVGSLFTGIGGFDLGLERAGMRVVFQCESDPWCRGILARHWPGVPCYEDVRAVAGGNGLRDGRRDTTTAEGGERPAPVVDLLAGGFPCQDVSVAGRRAGLDGARSGLFFEFARIADELVRPGGWIIVENVPGLLSSVAGRDFAVVLRTLGDIGFHDLAWRVLDSRYFGVPQRRRRVFIVGRRAAGRGAREVLLEPESGGGDFAPSRETGPRVAASLSRGSAGPGVSAGRRQEDDENIVGALMGASHGGGWRIGADEAAANHIVAAPLVSRSSRGRPQTLSAGHNTDGHIVAALVKRYAKETDSDATDALIAHPQNWSRSIGRPEPADYDDNTARAGHLVEADGRDEHGTGLVDGGARPTPSAGRRDAAEHGADASEHGAPPDPDGVRATPIVSGRLDCAARDPVIYQDSEYGVSRYDDAGTLRAGRIPEHQMVVGNGSGEAFDPPPDGPRYSAMGNAVTVNVIEWLGRRIVTWEQP